jgi:2'-5' RNA ligase
VTVLYPFVPPPDLRIADVDRLAEALGGFVAFDAVFPRVDWFGDAVVWLAPEPAEQFRRLTSVVGAAFPDLLPYDGGFDDVVPHLTIGGPSRGTVDELRLAADAVPSAAAAHAGPGGGRAGRQQLCRLVAHGRARPARELRAER